MKEGTRVMTPDGPGTVIKPGFNPPKKVPIMVKLDKALGMYYNYYYSEKELTVLKNPQ